MNEDVEISTKIPKELKEAVLQLQDYFDGKRTTFTFPLNPSGTDFQKKFGMNYFIFHLENLFLFRIIKKIR